MHQVMGETSISPVVLFILPNFDSLLVCFKSWISNHEPANAALDATSHELFENCTSYLKATCIQIGFFSNKKTTMCSVSGHTQSADLTWFFVL